MANIQPLTALNAQRWAKARVRGTELIPAAKRLISAEARYQAIEAQTGVRSS